MAGIPVLRRGQPSISTNAPQQQTLADTCHRDAPARRHRQRTLLDLRLHREYVRINASYRT